MSPFGRSLRRHELGSMMVLSLFMAIFMVGVLYYVLGIGDAVLYRRVMQDAADSGAFAASVVAAKGMNLHVLLNVVMAVTAGVLLVIRSVEVLLELILAVLHALAASIVLAPKAVPLIAVFAPAERAVESVGDGVEQFVRVAHDALDVAHHAVQHGYPLLAEARAVDAMVFEPLYDPPVVAGFVTPLLGARLPGGSRGLPVEKDDLGVSCDRVANAFANRLENVQSKAPRWLLRFLGGVVRRALQLGKSRTCSDDVVEAPRRALHSREDASEVWLGHEEFQYRAYDFGQSPHHGRWQHGEQGIRLSQGGAPRGRNALHAAHWLGQIGLAQSEYYFDGAESKPEWMWKQRWRARLRRFRFSESGLLSGCGARRIRGGLLDVDAFCRLLQEIPIGSLSAH